ncbi:thioredoxin family protein, partial [Dickeya dianthicola]
AAPAGFASVVAVSDARPYKRGGDALCVATDSEELKRSPKLFAVNPHRFTALSLAPDETLSLPAGDQLLLVGAERCVHCKSLYRQLETVIADTAFDGLSCHYLDADHHVPHAAQLQVRSLPTLLWLKDGQEQARLTGAQSADTLRQWLSAILR